MTVRSVHSRALAALAVAAVFALAACAAPADPSAPSAAPTSSESAPSASPAADDAATDDADADDASDGSGSEDSGSVGSGSSGSGSGGSGSSGGSGGGGSDPEPTTEAAPPAQPAVAVLSQQCTSGKLKVTLTASYDGGYRKGIRSVTLERQNEYGAWLDADATWLGPETGAGDQWTGNPPGHKNQRFQDQLRITAEASDRAETVLTVPITANC